MTDDERLDLRPLDPGRDGARLERLARAVAVRVAPGLAARRARAADAWSLLASWRRPVLAAAAALTVLSAVSLVRTSRVGSADVADTRAAAPTGGSPLASAQPDARATSTGTQSGKRTTIAEAAGLPGAIASYVEYGSAPDPSRTFDLQDTP